MSATAVGAAAERLARDYLEQRGYTLLCANYQNAHHEIDLVMREGETLVFVEVKARTSTAYGTPGAFVTKRKQGFLISAAEAYLIEHGLTESPARFDVIEIYLPKKDIVHIQDAFRA